jgi:peptidyl-prolyl cis-trans isomerase SurA
MHNRTNFLSTARLLLALPAALFVLAGLPDAVNAQPGPQTGRPVEIDRILVIVEDDVITEQEFLSQLNTIKRQLRARNRQLPPDDVLREQILERMVLDRLQLQFAERNNIGVTDEEIEGAISNVAQKNQVSIDQLRQALAQDGIRYADFRRNIRDQLVIRKVIEREVNNRVRVTEGEVDNFLLTNRDDPDSTREYDLSHILIAVPESATPDIVEAARDRATRLRQRLLDAELEFDQAAIEYSQGREALDGGSLGWRKAGELPELLARALSEMKAGDISDVLRTSSAFHIFKLNDVRGDVQKEVTQTRVRHILIRVDDGTNTEAAERRILQLRERIQEGADFAALARANSEDPGSIGNGGDLGWVDPGTLTPPFEAAMNALAEGDLSGPVRTQFGFHLIQVLDRRSAESTDERRRAEARAQIAQGKARERYEEWLRQLRDEAYVKFVSPEI